MEKKVITNINEKKLITCVYKLREVINEICCTIDKVDPSIEKLDLSLQLKKLMVEYMALRNK